MQGIYRAIYPNKCLFCDKVLTAKDDFLCACCAVLGHAPFLYDDVVKIPVFALKYSGVKTLVYPMARAMYASLPADVSADFLLPVPLHGNRIKERGFNQSELLAAELSEMLKIPAVDGLFRTRDTKPQNVLNPAQRKENISGAFALKDGFDPKNSRILLVDDIVTTGSTAQECEKLLMDAGALDVQLIVFAKA